MTQDSKLGINVDQTWVYTEYRCQDCSAYSCVPIIAS